MKKSWGNSWIVPCSFKGRVYPQYRKRSFYHVYCIPLMSGFLNQCYLQCAPFSCRKSYTHVSITFNNRPAILGTPSLVFCETKLHKYPLYVKKNQIQNKTKQTKTNKQKKKKKKKQQQQQKKHTNKNKNKNKQQQQKKKTPKWSLKHICQKTKGT